jgi:hypothetical protein
VLEFPVRTIHESQTRVGDEIVICSPESLDHSTSPSEWLNQVDGQQEEAEIQIPAAVAHLSATAKPERN